VAAAETVAWDRGESLGLTSEYLPLIQAGRMKAMGVSTEDGHVAFPVRTRSGLSLLAADQA
jgi:hypothetical protein